MVIYSSENQVDEFHPKLMGLREDVEYPLIRGVRMYHNRNTITFEQHWHSAAEILMPVSNGYTVHINAETHELLPGDILLIPPGTLHSYTPPESGERIFLLFEFGNISQIAGMRSLMHALEPCLLVSEKAYPLLKRELQTMMNSLIEEYDTNAPYAESSIWARILDMLTLIGRTNVYRTSHTREFPKDRRQDYVARFMSVCDYISDHISADITVEDLAEIAGFSKFHFSRLFKNFTGLSVHEYLITQRIAVAEQLLNQTDLLITDVAMNSGFGSISTFTRVFKERKGMTPSDYRAKASSDPTVHSGP